MTAETVERKVNKTWKNIANKRNIPSSITKSYVTHNSRLPQFYHLIKTHKNGPTLKIRPIVAQRQSPCYKLSKLMTTILNSSLRFIPSHLTNTNDLIQAIYARQSPHKNRYIFSLDVNALCTSVSPHEFIPPP